MVGDFEQAIKIFLECITLIESDNIISSDLVSPLVALGLAFNKSEQYNEAVEIFKRALHINWVNNGFYNLEQIKTLEKNIKNSKLKIFENCAHNVHLERPDQFNKTIRDFLLL